MAARAAVGGEDLAAGAAGDLRRLDAGARDGADVGGDVVQVLAVSEVRWHRRRKVLVDRPRVVDLVLDDPCDRVAVLAGETRPVEGIIEVRALGPAAGALVRELVAGAAAGAEEGLAAVDVGTPVLVAARDDECRDAHQDDGRDAPRRHPRDRARLAHGRASYLRACTARAIQ